MKLVIATKNRDKFKEIKAILSNLDLELLCSAEIVGMPDIDEDQDSIEGNSAKKAKETALFAQLPAIADDTGLFVTALNDEPGVHAARYAGEGCSYTDNVKKMLYNMKGKTNRQARFETVVSLAFPDKDEIISCRGVIYGQIIDEEHGSAGFGYDPIFQPDGYNQTFAELSDQVKNNISHRAQAFKEILQVLKNLL
ncbi:MAG: RdgB/HAM1 family non-canonical purine NTP pyrophosphatase [Candidatus Cloacimonadales bacterium]|jgi:XTP/dITP diphosphohydrolase|nr:RdgB/HAM1 family non-canonical purine NTP pyrophosphatase [Candidatus Cloacimonadota bacterium]MDD2650106.1 RdgB/HAM1 family non-canonical purine NTP pyrophosphatase [Candidatus Cloacimonadota bacterium]MDD3500936.1 RdgB/HAM1 family non-canonical purine NTP pyrophosphatase [Candidatus Cloacimonadota bacterium]MDX9978332.1 RdgB/HAM1 family non-canonical purine NTP pyrophosphatase [Candidatus Cloacimonadales bacterium]